MLEICYNKTMNTTFTEKQKLLKELTSAKASGLGYSLSSIFSILSSFLVLTTIIALGLNKEGYEQSDWYLYLAFSLPSICFAILTALFLKSGKITVGEITTKPKARYFILAIVLQVGLLSLSEIGRAHV